MLANISVVNHWIRLSILVSLLLLFPSLAAAQSGRTLYDQIKAFSLAGGKADVSGLTLNRDRVEMTFSGTFYFAAPVDGKITGAVFVGSGNVRAQAPPVEFEKANLKRLLGAEMVESDFRTAVLKFSDDTMDVIGKNKSEGAAIPQAQTLAGEFNGHVLKETGANIASRIALSMLNREDTGFFFANFDGGKRGRFTYVFDPQKRIPTDYFEINAGERGMIFKYDSGTNSNDVWMAFHSLSDYEKGITTYSDLNDLVDISNYSMNVDLRDPKKRLGLAGKIGMRSRLEGLRAVTFKIGENLGEYDNDRLNKQLRLKSVSTDQQTLEFVQEDWESGFTVMFPEGRHLDQSIDLNLELEGDFLTQPSDRGGTAWSNVRILSDCSYPRSNSSWYPRQGYLDRATFDLTFTHSKKKKVASTGTRLSETPDPANPEITVTKYVMKYPVALATFALGPFERHVDRIKWDNGDAPTPLEFNSMSGEKMAIKEDFILAEMNNSVRYFQMLFGKYPYDSFGAVFHPYGFGQGFATLLTIPNTDRASKWTYSFIAHETAHQWWGNIVTWRSYRDQWLSEGFAEYCGVLYTTLRDGPKSSSELIDEMRRNLNEPPETLVGIGKGRLVDVGPIILGNRVETKKTYGAYTALAYSKGGLVLRMLHFLFTDPGNGDGHAFFEMMKDFVSRYRDKVASTDDFRMVANEHFAKTPIARKYGLKDLNWFFKQWVYDTTYPSFKLEYQIESQPDGSVVVSGNVFQENGTEKFFMPMPVVFKFPGGGAATGTVASYGPKTPFSIKLPQRPDKMEMDPQKWVLSEKTSTK